MFVQTFISSRRRFSNTDIQLYIVYCSIVKSLHKESFLNNHEVYLIKLGWNIRRQNSFMFANNKEALSSLRIREKC